MKTNVIIPTGDRVMDCHRSLGITLTGSDFKTLTIAEKRVTKATSIKQLHNHFTFSKERRKKDLRTFPCFIINYLFLHLSTCLQRKKKFYDFYHNDATIFLTTTQNE